jgi:hypothetical protein
LIQIDPLKDGHVQLDGTDPQYFWKGKGVFGIEPVPDATYNLDVYIQDYPTDLTVDSQVPEIPMAFRPLVVLYACYRAYMKEMNYGAASLLHQMYQSELVFAAQDNLMNIPTARIEMTYQ